MLEVFLFAQVTPAKQRLQTFFSSLFSTPRQLFRVKTEKVASAP